MHDNEPTLLESWQLNVEIWMEATANALHLGYLKSDEYFVQYRYSFMVFLWDMHLLASTYHRCYFLNRCAPKMINTVATAWLTTLEHLETMVLKTVLYNKSVEYSQILKHRRINNIINILFRTFL